MNKLPKNIISQMEKYENDIRLKKQFIFDERETLNELNGSDDVADDKVIMKMEGLYHRYPTKVLIFPTESCFGECRFCFRKHIRKNKILSNEEINNALNYIRSNININEVILSGGDPMTICNRDLFNIISQIRDIPTVEIIRIHTRVLTYAPERIDNEFVDFIKNVQPLFMVFHINSYLELSDIAFQKAKLLADNGIYCFSQTALLHEINDSTDDLKQLFVTLLKYRIKPYYLFHPDKVLGNDHFYVSLDKGIKLYKSLFNNISGLATPTYLLNIPQGGGHCLVDLNNVKQIDYGKYSVTDWEGNIHNIVESFDKR